MPTFLLTNLKPIAAVLALLLYGSAVWRAHTIYDKAELSEQLAREIGQHKLDQAAANDHAADLERQLAKNRRSQADLTNELEKSYETIPDDCRVPDRVVRLLNRAIPAQDRNPG